MNVCRESQILWTVDVIQKETQRIKLKSELQKENFPLFLPLWVKENIILFKGLDVVVFWMGLQIWLMKTLELIQKNIHRLLQDT